VAWLKERLRTLQAEHVHTAPDLTNRRGFGFAELGGNFVNKFSEFKRIDHAQLLHRVWMLEWHTLQTLIKSNNNSLPNGCR
jgi:hypothetical protein